MMVMFVFVEKHHPIIRGVKSGTEYFDFVHLAGINARNRKGRDSPHGLV